MRRQVALGFQAGRSTPVAQGPSRRTQWDSNPQPLNTCVSPGAGSTTELSPFPYLYKYYIILYYILYCRLLLLLCEVKRNRMFVFAIHCLDLGYGRCSRCVVHSRRTSRRFSVYRQRHILSTLQQEFLRLPDFSVFKIELANIPIGRLYSSSRKR